MLYLKAGEEEAWQIEQDAIKSERRMKKISI